MVKFNSVGHTSVALSAKQQMVASCTGALAVSLFSTPFDVIKVRLQAQLKPSEKCFLFSNGLMEHVCQCGVPPALTEPLKCRINGQLQSIKFQSTFDAFVKIVKYEGVFQLWRGLPPTMLMAVPQTVIYFTTYDQLKVKLGLYKGSNFAAPLMSGVIARAFAVAAISPMEMVRTKLQSRNGHGYSDIFQIVRGAIKQEGFSSLWRGMGPTLLRDIPFSGMYWTIYEFIKSQKAEMTFSLSFAAGATAGMIAAILTTPFDVIKTHRQMELGENLLSARLTQSSPFTARLIIKLWRERGFRSLFTGMGARLAKVAPACAVMISTYEYGKMYFAQQNEYLRIFEST